jgi:hypothetical protein
MLWCAGVLPPQWLGTVTVRWTIIQQALPPQPGQHLASVRILVPGAMQLSQSTMQPGQPCPGRVGAAGSPVKHPMSRRNQMLMSHPLLIFKAGYVGMPGTLACGA